jgi:hypothetical protein
VTPPLRVVLDVNFYVRLAKAKLQQRTGTSAQRIFSALETGRVCGRPVQIVASHKMMDTLSDVLQRLSVPAEVADDFGRAIIDAMKAGPEELDPHVILGGTPDLRLQDAEDGGVLATAFAGRAHVLVTDNLADFMPGGCEVFETTKLKFQDGSRRVLTCQIIRWPDDHEVVVAHPVDFADWIGNQFDPTPRNIRERLSGARDVPIGRPKQK